MIEIRPEDHEQLITLADLKEFANEFARQLQAAPVPTFTKERDGAAPANSQAQGGL